MNNFILGKYIPYDSLIHKLDPRAKIIILLLFLVIIFIPAGFVGYGFLFCVILLITKLAKLKLGFIWKALKPMLLMLLFLLLINILVLKEGILLFQIWNIKVYSQAIVQTLYISVRLILMIMITTTLTASTKPLDMTLGIEDLLLPLKKFKVPAHEIAMMISISLRFIPNLIEDTERIMKAQASRGVDLQEGKLNEKIMGILSLIVPLFVSSFQMAEDLANAMESRGYVPGNVRTRYKQLKMTKRDYLAFIFVIFVIAVQIGISIWIA